MTVYAAQGNTYHAVIADMEKPPNLGPDEHWLACYVMLSRAKTLEGLLILRPALRHQLFRKPQQNLLDEMMRTCFLADRHHRMSSPRKEPCKRSRVHMLIIAGAFVGEALTRNPYSWNQLRLSLLQGETALLLTLRTPKNLCKPPHDHLTTTS
jgi:hypothetical protein